MRVSLFAAASLLAISSCLVMPPGGLRPTPSGGAASSTANPDPAPGSVSVTIRSACSTAVKVFFGDKPKYGGGTTSTVSSNSVSSHTFAVGDLFWIIDESENGVASATVRASTHEIQIAASCKDVAAH